MDPIPLRHNLEQKQCDVSHVIQEIFQTALEQEVLSQHRLANIELSSYLDDDIKDIFNKTCSDHEHTLEHIATVEEQLMTEHTKTVIENKQVSENKELCEAYKLKTKPWNEYQLTGDMKEYLIQPNDLLPLMHEQHLDIRLKKIMKSTSNTDVENIYHIWRILNKRPLPSSQPYRNSFEMKPRNNTFYVRRHSPTFKEEVIFEALPECIEFTDYEVGVKYEKTFRLKNISTSVGRFQIMPLPKYSKFHINLLPGITKVLASGLSLKVKVVFCTDSLKRVKEQLNISVDGGRNVTVALYACSDTVQLKDRKIMDFSRNIYVEDNCYISNNLMKQSPLPPIDSYRILAETENLKTPYIKRNRSSLKTDTIFEAFPNCLEFTDYKIGVKYEKRFSLKNVSKTVGKFQLMPLPKNSKFRIVFDLLPGITKMVAPGLSLRMKVEFCTDSLEDEKEHLNILVDGGMKVSVTLLAYREAPQLKVIDLLNLKETSSNEKESILCTVIECGQCMVGDTISRTIRLHNNGGGARFWLISEDDWCSENVMDVAMNNVILLPSFTISPSYFMVTKGGVIDINIKFLPMKFGLHTEKLYVICDNCSFRELDLIGDGFYYEDYFITVENITKTFQIDIEDDSEAKFYLDLGKIPPNGKATGAFNISNNSPMELQYIWHSRQPDIKCPTTPNFKSISEEHVYIAPDMGHFRSKTPETFTVFCNIRKAEIGHYRHVFQLYIKDLPPECVSKSCHPLKIAPSRNILDRGGVDILVKEVEIWLEVVPVDVFIEPCVISITGNKLRCDEQPLIRYVNIVNGSDSPLTCVWEMEPHFGSPATAVSCLFSITPSIFRLYPHSCIRTKFNIKIVNPGKAYEKFRCVINGGEYVLKLSIEVEVDDQIIFPSTRLLNFGLVKYGTLVKSPLTLISKSSRAAMWKMDEFHYSLHKKSFQHLEHCNLSPDRGFLCHGGSFCDLFYYLNTRKSGLWGSLLYQTIISSEGKISPTFRDCILVIGDIIEPHLQIQAPTHFTAILTPHGKLYLGMEVQCHITLKNLTRVSTSFSWEVPVGVDAAKLKVKFDPENGVIPGTQSMRIAVNITPQELGSVKNYYVTCAIGRVQIPVVLAIEAEVGGLSVNFHIPLDTEENEGKCMMHQAWSVKDGSQHTETRISKSDSNKTLSSSTHENENLAESVLNVESAFSSTEFGRDSESQDRRRSTGTKLDDELIYDNLNMALKLPHSSIYNTVADNLGENVDILHINELANANENMNEIDYSEIHDEFPGIDFIPSFPLSSPAAIQLSDEENAEHLKVFLATQDISVENRKETGIESTSNIANSKKYLESNSKEMEDILLQPIQNVNNTSRGNEDILIETKNTNSSLQFVTENQTSLVSVNSSESCTSYKGSPIIYFRNLPCHEAVKKTLVMENESPIPSSFTVSIANFYERENITEPSIVEQIQMKIAGKKPDMWKYRIREKAGIVFAAEPVAGNLGPYEVVYIDIWAYADTWGIYTDQMTCDVTGLAPFILDLEAQIIGFPLSFPMSYGSLQNKTIMRFGTLHYRGEPQKRRVRIKNESNVNINVNWHVFIEKEPQQPFTLILDIFDPINVKSSAEINSLGNKLCDEEYITSQEMKLNIAPYYGKEDFRIFQIRPGDITVPSKNETSFFIKVNPKICNPYIKDSLHLKAMAVGYVRISELDSRRGNNVVRPSGLDMEPVIFHMEATIEIPLFTVHHTKEEVTFRVNALDVMTTDRASYAVSRTLRVSNDKQASITAVIETTKPFEILRIKSLNWSIKHKASRHNMSLNSGQSAEIQVVCVFDRKIIDKALQFLKQINTNIVIQRVITLEGNLYLKQHNLLQQIVHLNAEIAFPNLVLHTEMLDFGPVFVNDTKQLQLVIQNKSALPVQIHLAKKFVVEEYHIEKEDILLSPSTAMGRNITDILISFTPSDPKEYTNKIEIQNCIPGDILEVSLTGVGTINKKFNMEG